MNPLIKSITNVTDDTFSSFENQEKYKYTFPPGYYHSEVRKQHSETMCLHLEQEVRKIPVGTLEWNVSYKKGIVYVVINHSQFLKDVCPDLIQLVVGEWHVMLSLILRIDVVLQLRIF